MKRITISLLLVMAAAVQTLAQKPKATTAAGTKKPDSAISKPTTKLQKTQSDADGYIKMADDAKTRLRSWFPSRAGDTIYFVIAGINYADPNLRAFKKMLDDVKNTKGLTSGYRNSTAVIKIIYKGGDASTLYDSLPEAAKEMFVPEDMEGNRAILTYKMAVTKQGD